MNNQIIWIANLFNKYNINYWLDSGTLLGIMRDGQIIKGDKDIDIGMWVKDEIKMKKLLSLIVNEGYLVDISSYGNYNFKYKFIPKENNRELFVIDISLFNVYQKYAWCPQVLNPRIYYKLSYKLRRFISNIYFLYRKNKKVKNVTKIQMTQYPNLLKHLETWWIPVNYFKETIFLKDLRIFVSKDWENYLEFRYGNWRIANKDWVFINDDKGLIHKKPTELVFKK